MSKQHRNPWDDESYEFRPTNIPQPDLIPDIHELDDPMEDSEFLEEAHEALSKLFNKTNKRAKQMKGVRKKDAWQ